MLRFFKSRSHPQSRLHYCYLLTVLKFKPNGTQTTNRTSKIRVVSCPQLCSTVSQTQLHNRLIAASESRDKPRKKLAQSTNPSTTSLRTKQDTNKASQFRRQKAYCLCSVWVPRQLRTHPSLFARDIETTSHRNDDYTHDAPTVCPTRIPNRGIW